MNRLFRKEQISEQLRLQGSDYHIKRGSPSPRPTPGHRPLHHAPRVLELTSKLVLKSNFLPSSSNSAQQACYCPWYATPPVQTLVASLNTGKPTAQLQTEREQRCHMATSDTGGLYCFRYWSSTSDGYVILTPCPLMAYCSFRRRGR